MADAGIQARRVADADAEGGGARRQRRQRVGGNSDAPAAVRAYHAAIALSVQRHGDKLTRFHVGGGAGKRLRAALLAVVENIVAGEGVNGNRRRTRRGWRRAVVVTAAAATAAVIRADGDAAQAENAEAAGGDHTGRDAGGFSQQQRLYAV